MGLVDDAEFPIAKPCHISINDPVIWQAMNAQRCPGKAAHPRHSECQGKYAKRSENYTPAMARVIHRAWRDSAKQLPSNAFATVYPTWLRPNSDSRLGCKAKKMPSCVGPPVDAATHTNTKTVAAAEQYVESGKRQAFSSA